MVHQCPIYDLTVMGDYCRDQMISARVFDNRERERVPMFVVRVASFSVPHLQRKLYKEGQWCDCV